METVTVTALKHDANIQDVPMSMQAFSGDTLNEHGIANTSELGALVPSLQWSSTAGFPIIFLRGMGTDNFVTSADPSVSTYIDGIYMPNGLSMLNSLAGVEQVEVLKGPQGTLYGRNSDGGAISIVTAAPGRHFELATEGEVGNFNDRVGQLSMSGPLTNWLSAGIFGITSRQDSYYTDTLFATQQNEVNAGRVKIDFHPMDNLSVMLTAYRSIQSGTQDLLAQNIAPSPLGRAFGIQAQTDDFVAQSNYPTGSNSSQNVGYGTLKWGLPWFDLKVLGSYQHLSTPYSSVDFDASPQALVGLTTTNTFTSLRTAEVQLLSNGQSWHADHLTWVAGLYYLDELTGADPGYMHIGQGFSTSVGVGNGGATIAFNGILGTRSSSLYSQATYRFTSWLDFTLGGRLQHEDRYLTTSQVELPALLPNNPPHQVNYPVSGTMADNFAPKAVIGLHPYSSTLLYASYAVGYKSGTYNIVNLFGPSAYVPTERTTAYEVGEKYTLGNGRLIVNGALFDNEVTNMQAGFVSLLSAGAVNFVTVPHARSQGGELEARWLALDGANPLIVSVNTAYVDGVYNDWPHGPGFQQSNGLYSGNLDLTGDQIVYTPRWSGTLGATQLFHTRIGRFELGADEFYSSGFYADAYNTARQGTYAVLNTRAGYRFEPWKMQATLFCSNALDRRYAAVESQTDFGLVRTLAAPRQYGARVRWDF